MTSHGRSIFLYLSELIDGFEIAQVKSRYFEPLLAADPTAVFTHIDATPHSHLHNHIWYLSEGRWKGLLVICPPLDAHASDSLADLWRPSYQWLLSARKRVLGGSDFGREPLLNALALALRTCERQGTVVLLLHPALIGQRTPTSPSLLSSPETEGRFFTITATSADRDFYQTLRSHHDYGFATPQISAVANLGIRRLTIPPSDNHDFVPTDAYTSWIQEELHDDRVATALFRIVGAVVPTFSERLNPSSVCLPAPFQIALGTVRVCRCMATWTLEGAPFECTAMLVQDQDVAEELELTFPPAFVLTKPVPFTFDQLKEIRKCAEMVHATDLLMTIGLDRGQLFQLSATAPSERLSNSRHELFPLLTASHNVILVHCRHGFVEVYASGDLQLWYDGFRWHVRPFHLLREVLSQFFHQNNQIALRFQAAISTLLDRQESSILVLAHRDDQESFCKNAAVRMREGIEPSASARAHFAGQKLSVDTVVGLLRLDGAHCIDHNGKLSAWARNINISEARTPASDANSSEFTTDVGHGAGARAALALSSTMPKSIVIKTSASGYIKIYQDGKEYLGLRRFTSAP